MKSWRKSRKLFLTTVATGAMLNPLNSSMIALALYSIQKDFGLSYLTVSWLISSFYIASAVAQPIAGRLGDLIGRRRMFLGGLVFVAISAIGAPLSPIFALLIMMRLFQAVGSGSIYPAGIGMIRDHIQERQGAALAFISMIMSSMAALGPTIGGALISWGGWEAIFLINLPILLYCFIAAWLILPKDEKRKNLGLRELREQMDVGGIFLFSAGIIGLLVFLLSFKTSLNIGAGIIGFVFLAWFVRHELKTNIPFINIRLFTSNRRLSFIYLQYMLQNLIYYSLFFGLPGYFQDGLQLSVSYSGMLMLFVSGMGIVIAPLAGRWVDKAGVHAPILLGNSLIVIGAVLLMLFFGHVPVFAMVLIISLIGAGCSFGNVTLQAAMLQEIPSDMIGVSTGLYQMCRHLGSTLSAVALGLIFGDYFTTEHFPNLILMLLTAGVVMLLLGISYSRAKSAAKAA